MSQRQGSEHNYGSSRSASNTQRNNQPYEQDNALRPHQTERQLHEDSPTRHDVEFYVRKVNRYQNEIARLEHDLSVAKFKLSKAEDYETKYDLLFKQNQKTVSQYLQNRDELQRVRRDLDRVRVQNEKSNQRIKALQSEVDIEKRNNQDLRNKKQEQRHKTTNQGQSEREALKEYHTKQIDNIKKQSREIQEKLKREINELQNTINMKEAIQQAISNKLEHIKKQKNSEINRLKELVTSLRDQLGNTHIKNESDSIESRTSVINETEDRINNVRRLGQLIEETLIEEINSLNDTLRKKNDQINFMTEADKRQLEYHENSEQALKKLVAKLQDKIFTIQRQNELQLYDTINRLKTQYQDNLRTANAQWEAIRVTHNNSVQGLRKHIQEQNQEIQLLSNQNRNLQVQHKNLAEEKQHSIQMLSQKIIALEKDKDQELKNYTTSMKQIEDDAKAKMQDLHTSMQNKNAEGQILQAQITLKNGQITHLLEEISNLRDVNRQKIKKLQNTNAIEQNNLNNEISSYKKLVLELKRTIHELEGKFSDSQSAHQLEKELLKHELQSQKEANEFLRARNAFLTQWCNELQRDLKAQRVNNVNILHDHNLTQRENVQVRQQVRVQLQAVKNKEVQQIKNIHKLEKNRLESQLAKREHELRDKKEQLGRLLVQYKALQAKIGKSSKVDRSAQDQGKCRATLQAQILLTQNIFNAINTQ